MPAGGTVRGRLAPPPSKSLTHRAFNLALLARSPVVVENPLDAEDTRLFRAALTTAGFAVEEGPGEVTITPPAASGPGGAIDCGNAGTMFRFLVASLAVTPGVRILDGKPRLRERTVGPLIEALRTLGARIDCLGEEGFAPLRIYGSGLAGGRVTLDAGSSSQFLSALLMAGLAASGPVTIEVAALASEPYVDLTLDSIHAFGGRVDRPDERSFRVHPGPLTAKRVRVEGDFSAACYPAAAAALTGGSVTLTGLGRDSHQGDRRFFHLLERMGARVAWREGADGEEIAVTGDGLEAIAADLSSMPDQVPTLAALAPFACGVTRIFNVPHLRIKESDRLGAMAAELGRLGVPVEEEADALTIPGIWAEGPPPADPVEVETYDDHRIAMSLGLVGLRRPGVIVSEPGVVAKSYPDFWRDLDRLLR